MSNYEEYARVIEYNTGLYTEKIAKAMDKVSTIATNVYYSDKGKQAKRQKIYDEMNSLGKNFSGISREATFRFLQDYQIKLPSDGKDHKIEIDNALRVISMLGGNLDLRNLNNALDPLRGDFRSMKYVLDVLDQKSKSGIYSTNISYDIKKQLGINEDIINYVDQYSHIQDLLNDVSGMWYSYSISTVGSSVVMSPSISYNILSLPETIRSLGALHDELSNGSGHKAPSDMDLLKSLVS